ncbi:MAG: hypothetical protein WBB71_00080, partial [Candidatus Saccharimonas aalborgensis]
SDQATIDGRARRGVEWGWGQSSLSTRASLLARCSDAMIRVASAVARMKAAMTIKKMLLIPAPYGLGTVRN